MRLILWRIGFFWPDSIDSFFYFFSDYLLLLIVSFAACAFWVNGYWKKSVWITVIKPSAVYCITCTVMPRPKCAIHTTKVRGFVWLIACVCVCCSITPIFRFAGLIGGFHPFSFGYLQRTIWPSCRVSKVWLAAYFSTIWHHRFWRYANIDRMLLCDSGCIDDWRLLCNMNDIDVAMSPATCHWYNDMNESSHFTNIFFFSQKFQFITYGKEARDLDRLTPTAYNQVYADITTTFTILIGIFFPSVTGGWFLYIFFFS